MPEVTGTWESGGDRRAGTWQVYLPVRLTDAGGNLVHPKGVYAQGDLLTDEDDPSLTVELLATDDPDLSPQDYQWRISIRFASGGSEIYTIPVTDDLDLSDVVLPQTIPAPQPVLIRGVPGGIAELDGDGLVPLAQLPDDLGGPAAWDDITGKPATFPPTIGATGSTAVAGNDARLTDARNPSDGSVTNAKVAVGAAIDLDKTADSATRLAMSAAERTKLSGVATGATANAADAALRDRSTHTGTQLASTVSDLTEAVQDVLGAAVVEGTNVDVTYDDGAGTLTVATTATVNATDAQLRDRSTHTGTQAPTTITGLTADAAELNILDGATLTTAELNHVDGVTSAIQAQIDAKQASDADLTTIAGLTATTDNFLQAKASAWASRTVAQVKTDLGLTGTNSGDQTSIVGITGTKAQFDTAVSDGNILYVGDVAGISDGDKGDITVSGSGATWTVDSGAVTYAKLQDVSATSRILGRVTAGAGDVEELTAADVRTLISLLTDLNSRPVFALPRVGDWINQASALDITTSPPANGDLWAGQIWLPGGSYDKVAVNISGTAGSAGALMKVVGYADDNGRPGSLLFDSPTADVTTTGTKEITLSSALVIPAGGQMFWAGSVVQGAPSTLPTPVRVRFYPGPVIRTVASLGTPESMAWVTTGITGAAPGTAGNSSMTGTHTRLAFKRSA